MKLIFKYPANKPPVICILFDNAYNASKLNQSFVNEHKNDLLVVTFEMQESKLDLILKLEEGKLNYRYKNLKYTPDKLISFLQSTKGSALYSFCHIVFHKSKHEVVKTIPGQTLWVLKVGSVEMSEEY